MKNIKELLFVCSLVLLVTACEKKDEVKKADRELQLANLSAQDHSAKEVSEVGLAQVGCKFIDGEIYVELKCRKAESIVERSLQEVAKKNYTNSATQRLQRSFTDQLKLSIEIIKNKKLSVALSPRFPMAIYLSPQSAKKYLVEEAKKEYAQEEYTYRFLITMLWQHDLNFEIAKNNTVRFSTPAGGVVLSDKAIKEVKEYLLMITLLQDQGLEANDPYVESVKVEARGLL